MADRIAAVKGRPAALWVRERPEAGRSPDRTGGWQRRCYWTGIRVGAVAEIGMGRPELWAHEHAVRSAFSVVVKELGDLLTPGWSPTSPASPRPVPSTSG